MGGRGAGSGMSVKGNRYGTQHKSYFTLGNIKFVAKTSRQSETLMETRTKGRIDATVGGNKLVRLTFHNDNTMTIIREIK